MNYIYFIFAGHDHGVKAQGDGWLLTVALIEGNSIASVHSCGLSDPFVVLTCNGKTKTSSIKFQTANPEWNGNTTRHYLNYLANLHVFWQKKLFYWLIELDIAYVLHRFIYYFICRGI